MSILNKQTNHDTTQEVLDRWDWMTESIADKEVKLNTSIMLENSYSTMLDAGQLSEGWLESVLKEEDLNEAPVVSTAVGTNLIPRVMFPMIRRVFPNLIANKLVSVQPITGPTGVIYYVSYDFTNTKGAITAGKEYTGNITQGSPAFDPFYSAERIGPFTGTIDASGADTSITAGAAITSLLGTAAAPTLKRIEVYPSTEANLGQFSTVMAATGTAAAPTWGTYENTYYDYDGGIIVLRDVADGAAVPWTAGTDVTVFVVYNQEASEIMPEMEFSINSDTVNTTERKLKIRWTKESEQDMKAYHKIDVESELVKVASMEMNYEIDREIIKFIGDSVTSSLSFMHDWKADASGTGNNTQGNYLDRHRALAQKIYQVGSRIAQFNRLGAASWSVVSPQVGALLSMLPDFKGEINGKGLNIFESGMLANGLSVFVDPNRATAGTEEILMGYKSNDTTYGAGVVYAPYTNWMSNTVTHPDSFNSIRGFFSRYALKLVPRGQYFYGRLLLNNYGL